MVASVIKWFYARKGPYVLKGVAVLLLMMYAAIKANELREQGGPLFSNELLMVSTAFAFIFSWLALYRLIKDWRNFKKSEEDISVITDIGQPLQAPGMSVKKGFGLGVLVSILMGVIWFAFGLTKVDPASTEILMGIYLNIIAACVMWNIFKTSYREVPVREPDLSRFNRDKTEETAITEWDTPTGYVPEGDATVLMSMDDDLSDSRRPQDKVPPSDEWSPFAPADNGSNGTPR